MPSGGASFVLQASLYYPTTPYRDPSLYSADALAAVLLALKCDYSGISGVLADTISYSAAVVTVNTTAAPGLVAAVAAAAAAASSAVRQDCVALAQAAPPPAAILVGRRALQPSSATVSAAAPLIRLSVVFIITPDAPIVATVPRGTSVMPAVLARLTAAASNARLFPTSNAVWSAANAVSAWYANSTFFTSAAPTVAGDTGGTLAADSLSPAQTLGLALGLAIPLAIAAVAIAAYVLTGSAACCCCCCACCSGAGACGRGRAGALKPLDPEIAHDREALDLVRPRAAELGDMMRGYAAEAADHKAAAAEAAGKDAVAPAAPAQPAVGRSPSPS